MAVSAAARRNGGWAPWATAAVAGAILVALLVVYFVVFLPYRRDYAPGQLTASELTAMTAATTELDNVGALGGKNFDTNYSRAIAGSTGPFRQDLLRERSAAQKNLAGHSATAVVTQRAVVGPVSSGGTSGYQLLMNLSGPQSSITSALLAPQQVSVTVVHQNGKWLVSDIRSVGITS